jgi:spore germination protein KA
MNSLWKRLRTNLQKRQQNHYYEEENSENPSYHITENLSENLSNIKSELGNSSDLIIREFKVGKNNNYNMGLASIDGLIDQEVISDFILETLMIDSGEINSEEFHSPKAAFEKMKDKILTLGEIKVITDWKKMMLSILSGDTVMFIDGLNEVFACSTKGGELRSISEPLVEASIRGPKDSFTEALRTNTALVRRRIKSSKLWLETIQLGEYTQTDVAIMYVKGIANDKLVEEVRERLGRIKVDEVLSSNTVEEFIADKTFTLWPTTLVTERPDVVAGNIMEGRIVVFVDGTPHPLIVPATWNQFLQSAEDYYLNWYLASFIRFVRYISFLLTLLGPSIYIAFISFHPELIPTSLLINLAAQRAGIPFPVFVEALLMEFTFEILREAGVRMPRPVGQAVSIVGALVLGEAAVSAGIVSSAMVIVVAATAIGSFTIPHFQMIDSVRILRFGMMALAASFGIYGIGLGVIVLVAHTASLRSFGIPYLAPFAPMIPSDNVDTILRFPKPLMKTRPRLISQTKINKMESNQKPKPSPRNNSVLKNHESKRDSDET